MVHNIAAESAYLASCLIGGVDAYKKAPLKPSDFYRDSHRKIMAAIEQLAANNQDIDIVTVAGVLTRNGHMESVGITNLNVMVDLLPTSANIKSYAKEVVDAARRRDLSVILTGAIKSLSSGDQYAENVIESLVSDISRVQCDRRMKPGRVDESHIFTIDDMIRSYKDHISSIKKNTLKTGITWIDNNIRGVSPGEVLTIIAGAGTFKTALLQNILVNHAERSDGIAVFFSLEMPVPMVFERYQQMLNKFEGRRVEQLYCRGDSDIPDALIREKLRNVVVIPVKVSLGDMAKYIPLVEKKTGRNVTVVGIDYLGLVDSRGDSEYQRNSEVARGTKDFAKDTNLPVILLSQISRKSDEEVTINAGRGSGAIEEGADFLLGMWQREVNQQLELVCAILKNRKGQKNIKRILAIDPEYMRFSNNSTPYLSDRTPRRAGNVDL